MRFIGDSRILQGSGIKVAVMVGKKNSHFHKKILCHRLKKFSGQFVVQRFSVIAMKGQQVDLKARLSISAFLILDEALKTGRAVGESKELSGVGEPAKYVGYG